MSGQLRTLLLVLDAVALVGVVGFSVGAIVERDNAIYLLGQIICVAVVLGSVLALHRLPPSPDGDTLPEEAPHE